MIRVTLVAVEANSSVLFMPTGTVTRWSRGVLRDIEKEVIKRTPGTGGTGRSAARHGSWATGQLAASFYRLLNASPPQHNIKIEFGNTSDHAMFVHEGTANAGTGYIYTRKGYLNRAVVDQWIATGTRTDERGYLMPVTRIPGRTRHYLRVRGQYPNPFLRHGFDRALKRHRIG